MLGWLWWQLDGLYGHTHRLYSRPLRTVANTSLVEGIHWLTMVLSALLDQSSAALGPTLCPEMTRGQRTFCYTTLQIGESDKASLCRDTKALCRGRRVCELESSHALAMKQCVCWGGTELPRNTVGNIAFLSMVFRGTQSGNILLIISSLLSRPVSTELSFPTQYHGKGRDCEATIGPPAWARPDVSQRAASARPDRWITQPRVALPTFSLCWPTRLSLFTLKHCPWLLDGYSSAMRH